MPVNSPCAEYQAYASKWRRLRDCDGGRDAIIRAGALYCPDLPGADATANTAYRLRGNFYNATRRTVEGMVGSLFRVPPDVATSQTVKPFLEDISTGDVPFETFASDVAREVILLNRCGVLIDVPSVPMTPVQPYCVFYRAEDIINWRVYTQDGDKRLNMIVLRETETQIDPNDKFVWITRERYRVIELIGGVCVQTIYTLDEKGKEWLPSVPTVIVRRGTPLNFIPFVMIPGLDLEDPALLDLADINLAHWRNSVDHEYGLHLVSLPTPWVAGLKSVPADGKVKIGPSVIWDIDVQGKAGMLEFSGEGLDSLVKAMDEKKKQMATQGARLLEDQAVVDETATAVRARHSGENSTLQSMAQALELGLKRVLQTISWWVGVEETPADVTTVKVEINKEFVIVKASAQDITAALQQLQAEKISYATYYDFLRRGSWTRENVSAEEELEEIKKDAASRPPEPEEEEEEPEEPPPTKRVRTVRDANGAIKYQIEDEEPAA